jgi:hypothetical protein
MNPARIKRIIKHTGKLLKEVLTELFGDPEKEKEESDDTVRDKEPD